MYVYTRLPTRYLDAALPLPGCWICWVYGSAFLWFRFCYDCICSSFFSFDFSSRFHHVFCHLNFHHCSFCCICLGGFSHGCGYVYVHVLIHCCAFAWVTRSGAVLVRCDCVVLDSFALLLYAADDYGAVHTFLRYALPDYVCWNSWRGFV